MRRQPFKWLLLSLIALTLAFWLSGISAVAQTSSPEQTNFKIGGDLVIAADETVTDTFVIGGDLTLQPGVVVEGEAFAIGGDIRLEENVQVAGDIFAVGGEIIRDPSATIGGSEFTVMERFSGVFDRFGVLGTLYLVNVAFWLTGFLALALSGGLFLLLLPARVKSAVAALRHRPIGSLGYGLAGLLGLSLVTVLLGGSALGAIAIPLVNLIAVLFGLFGLSAGCVWLGHQMQRSQTSDVRFQHFALGLVLLFIVGIIPFFGGLLVSLFSLFSFGAAILSQYDAKLFARPRTAKSANWPVNAADLPLESTSLESTSPFNSTSPLNSSTE